MTGHDCQVIMSYLNAHNITAIELHPHVDDEQLVPIFHHLEAGFTLYVFDASGDTPLSLPVAVVGMDARNFLRKYRLAGIALAQPFMYSMASLTIDLDMWQALDAETPLPSLLELHLRCPSRAALHETRAPACPALRALGLHFRNRTLSTCDELARFARASAPGAPLPLDSIVISGVDLMDAPGDAGWASCAADFVVHRAYQ